VAVQGKLCYRTWKDAEGTQRTTAEVVASQVRFLGAASGGEGASPAAQSRAPAGNADYQAEPEPFSDDDIPF
jgi:single-stranded DNA-binding protein